VQAPFGEKGTTMTDKLFVTYSAPAGDDQIVSQYGLRFIDGMTTEVDTENPDNALAISKLKARNSPNWTVSDTKPRGATMANTVSKSKPVPEPEPEAAGSPHWSRKKRSAKTDELLIDDYQEGDLDTLDEAS